ncbi:MAG TPA: lysophospholipid acyltransferase family protein [Acetobacteraceae bacterium]|jgi:1-acyl-sn-glycerol-3-phosphate acyltransferase
MTLLRSTLFNLYFFTMTFVLTLVLATPTRFLAPHRVLDVARLWARLLLSGVRLICGIRLSVTGLERVGAGPCVIASAHQSAFDTFVWLALLPRCCYVLKKELLRIPLFGPLLPLAGMIAVDRHGGASAMRHLLRDGDRAVREDRQIVIFPEGTRAAPGERLPLQPGVAALATRTRLPVIPVVTDSGRYWGRRAFQKRPGTINIRLLEPLSPEAGRDRLMSGLEQALRGGAVENSVG